MATTSCSGASHSCVLIATGHESAANAADLTLEGIAEIESGTVETGGLQIYKSDDERQMAFPCLVHVDISVVGHRLNVMAVYRHWHLVHKAYGNLIGLTRLLHFLSQQTGYEPGELMIHATVANAELGKFSHKVLKGTHRRCSRRDQA